jgi:hypothetical protein
MCMPPLRGGNTAKDYFRPPGPITTANLTHVFSRRSPRTIEGWMRPGTLACYANLADATQSHKAWQTSLAFSAGAAEGAKSPIRQSKLHKAQGLLKLSAIRTRFAGLWLFCALPRYQFCTCLTRVPIQTPTIQWSADAHSLGPSLLLAQWVTESSHGRSWHA